MLFNEVKGPVAHPEYVRIWSIGGPSSTHAGTLDSPD